MSDHEANYNLLLLTLYNTIFIATIPNIQYSGTPHNTYTWKILLNLATHISTFEWVMCVNLKENDDYMLIYMLLLMVLLSFAIIITNTCNTSYVAEICCSTLLYKHVLYVKGS